MASLQQLLEADDTKIKSKKSHRDLMDYLFLVWTPRIDFTAASDEGCGFINSSSVVLTNSIGLAEQHRLQTESCRMKDQSMLLLCKVYTGTPLEHTDDTE